MCALSFSFDHNNMKFPKINIKSFLMGRGLFLTLALLFLTATILFSMYQFIFVFTEINNGLGESEEKTPIAGFNLKGFQELGLMKTE